MELREKLTTIVKVFDHNRISYNQALKESLQINYANNSVAIINEKIIDYLFLLANKAVTNGLTKIELANIEDLTKIEAKLAKIKKEKEIQNYEAKVEDIIMSNPIEINKEGMILEAYKWLSSINKCAIIMFNRATREKEREYFDRVIERCQHALDLLENCRDAYSKQAYEYEVVVCDLLNKYSPMLASKNTSLHLVKETFDKIDTALERWSSLAVMPSKKDKQKEYVTFQEDNPAQLVINTEGYREDLDALKEKLDSYVEITKELQEKCDEKTEALKQEQQHIDDLKHQMDEIKKSLISGKISKDEALIKGQRLKAEIDRCVAKNIQTDKGVKELLAKIQLRNIKGDKIEENLQELFAERDNSILLAAYMSFIDLKAVYSFIDGISTSEEADRFFSNLVQMRKLANIRFKELNAQVDHLIKISQISIVEETTEYPGLTRGRNVNVDKELEALFGPLNGVEEPEQKEEEVKEDQTEDITQIIK